MANARVAVDYFGTGHLQDIFQGTLPLSYISGKINVPPIPADSSGFGSWEFDVPIEEPFLFCTPIVGSQYYFEKVSTYRWRLRVVGKYMVVVANRVTYPPDKSWKKPNFNDEGEIKILYGGYRG